MKNQQLSGRRVLVVGASSGVGRTVARKAVEQGADVVVVARRGEALRELIIEGGGGRSISADITSPDDCARVGTEVAQMLGSLDVVLISSGVSVLKRIEQHDVEDWLASFAVNVIGVNMMISALLPVLASRAIVAVISTENIGAPRWGLASYCASKAALEESMRSWRIEHPQFRFTTIPIGVTVGTEMGQSFGHEILFQALEKWAAAGMQTQMMGVEEVAGAVVDVLGAVLDAPSLGVENLVLRPAAAQTGSADIFKQAVAETNLVGATSDDATGQSLSQRPVPT